MAKYQIFKQTEAGAAPLVLKAGGGQELVHYDDEQWALPGEDGYDGTALADHLAGLGPDHIASVAGRSPGVEDPSISARREADAAARKAEIEQDIADRLAQREDPEGFARGKKRESMMQAQAEEAAQAIDAGVAANLVDALTDMHAADLAKFDAAG